jgi:hypothetical protein
MLGQIMAIIVVLTTWTFADTSTASAAEALRAPQSPLPVALRRACPVGDRAAAEYQVVRTFERSPGHAIGWRHEPTHTYFDDFGLTVG